MHSKFRIETVVMDVRHAFRVLMGKPVFTLAAILTLALAIGANTAIFSVVNGVLLSSLKYRAPESIVVLWETNLSLKRDRSVVSAANLLDWQERSTAFDQVAAISEARANLIGQGDPEEIKVQLVGSAFFPILGVQPQLGRAFDPSEDKPGGNPVLILSHRLWQRRFGGESTVLGKTLALSGRPHTIVGVMPAGFSFLDSNVDAWTALAVTRAQFNRDNSGRFLRAVGRLKSGVSVQQAQADLSGIASQLGEQYPGYNKGWDVAVVPIREQIVRDIRPTVIVLFAAVVFVLLIACTNVANLQSIRAAERQKEFAIRAALGASGASLIRQMLTECVLVSLLGGALGLFLAYGGIQALVALAPDNIPHREEITLNSRVLGFSFLVSLATGIIFGLLPALHASRVNVNEGLKEGAGRATRASPILRNTFMVTQLSVAFVLLIGAGLMFRSFLQLQQVNTGFSTENLLTLRVQLPVVKYPRPQDRAQFIKQAEERIAAIPGVKIVGAINFLPLDGLAASTSFAIEGKSAPAPGSEPGTEVRAATPGYFQAMGIPLLQGRALDVRDGGDSTVALINQTFARRYFQSENPIGQRITLNWDPKVTVEIVGIVADVAETALEHEPKPMMYWPYAREASRFMHFVVRGSIEPMGLVPAVQAEIRRIDPDQPISDIRPMADIVSNSIAHPRFNAFLLGIFGVIALMLACIGLYGVISYSVAQQTRDIGIRMALGASPYDIMRLILGRGIVITIIGVTIGLACSLALTRLMQSMLFAVSRTDPQTYLATCIAFGVTAIAAMYIPARKATRVDPNVALREE
jgi:putative ABC transport system permease protein